MHILFSPGRVAAKMTMLVGGKEKGVDLLDKKFNEIVMPI